MKGLTPTQRANAERCALRICRVLEHESTADATYGAGLTNGNSSMAFSRRDSHGTLYYTQDEAMDCYWNTDAVTSRVRNALARATDSKVPNNVIPFPGGKS